MMYKYFKPNAYAREDEPMSGALDHFNHFKTTFNQLNANTLNLLDEIYTPDVVFRDPVHALEGLPALRDYYGRLYAGVVSCQFEFESEVVDGPRAMLVWIMRFQHRQFRRGELLDLRGVSHLKFRDDGKVFYHHDYFDMGAFIYERVHLLGSVIRFIKGRL
jgi:SnoaL-like domain